MKTLKAALLTGAALVAIGGGLAQSGTASAATVTTGPQLVAAPDCGPGNWLDTATGFCTVNLSPQSGSASAEAVNTVSVSPRSAEASAQRIGVGPQLIADPSCGSGNWIDTATGFCTVNPPSQ